MGKKGNKLVNKDLTKFSILMGCQLIKKHTPVFTFQWKTPLPLDSFFLLLNENKTSCSSR